MKINEIIHGFTVKSSEYISEVSGTLYMLEHTESGAPLAYLDRDDENMTFSIAFRTPPSDETGVFHIIEHSVLCGSKKFPVKEPFVELLKGSLNTFLNAMTYEDRTVYPVSSRCERDFLNLTDVYLDAVFHPKMLENENIFLQEGWHYEYDEAQDTLSYNGVVYNEMRGAYSSPDEVGGGELRRALFKDNLYKYDSGGSPDAIPTLTYEQFKKAHETYYHPSNSMIFLDGKINLNKTLALIASYLNEYEKTDIKVEYPIHAPEASAPTTVEFEPSADMGARLLLGYVYSAPDRKFEDYSLTLLTSALAGSNEAQLKSEVLKTRLCEDLVMSVSRVRQDQITIEAIGVKEENIEKIPVELERIIRDIASRGIDKDRLLATVNNNAFKMREQDFGALPRGVAFALTAYSLWTYGIYPGDALKYEEEIATARENINSDYYEKLLLMSTVDNPHTATVIMKPRRDFAKIEQNKRAAALAEIKSAMSGEDIKLVCERNRRLDEWQNTQDTEENLDTIPTLSLSDIRPTRKPRKTITEKIEGAVVLSHGIDCSGIIYVTLNLAADDLDGDELLLLSLLSILMKNLKTKSMTAAEFQNSIKSNLGSLSVSAATYPKSDGSGDCSLALSISASALEENSESLVSLLGELFTTDFSDTSVIEKHLIQTRSAMEELITSDSLSFALSRVSAQITRAGVINERMSGLSAYKKIKAICAEYGAKKDDLSKKLASLLSRLAVKGRLTISLAGGRNEELCKNIVALFQSGQPAHRCELLPQVCAREGIALPIGVAYATQCALSPEACEIIGTMRVVRSILSYEYLWNAVRVKGGAYGAGFIVRKSGELGLYSYRDPSPAASLEIYKSCPNYLRRLAKDGTDLTKFIIGAVGEYDILTTPRTEAAQALYDYMTDWSAERESALYRGMLTTDGEHLKRAADVIERALDCSAVCVAASREVLDTVSPALSLIEI